MTTHSPNIINLYVALADEKRQHDKIACSRTQHEFRRVITKQNKLLKGVENA